MKKNPETRHPVVWKLDPSSISTEVLKDAANRLRRGQIAIYPTETFYGLGGIPDLEDTIERIYRMKRRDPSKPLPLIASSLMAVFRVVDSWPSAAERLADALWPGPVTLVLPASSTLSPLVHAYTHKVAVRVSSHPIAQAVAAVSGGILIATSANISDEKPQHDPGGISQELLDEVDFMIDGGTCGAECRGLASTVVDLCGPCATLIRDGCIPWEEIRMLVD